MAGRFQRYSMSASISACQTIKDMIFERNESDAKTYHLAQTFEILAARHSSNFKQVRASSSVHYSQNTNAAPAETPDPRKAPRKPPHLQGLETTR